MWLQNSGEKMTTSNDLNTEKEESYVRGLPNDTEILKNLLLHNLRLKRLMTVDRDRLLKTTDFPWVLLAEYRSVVAYYMVGTQTREHYEEVFRKKLDKHEKFLESIETDGCQHEWIEATSGLDGSPLEWCPLCKTARARQPKEGSL